MTISSKVSKIWKIPSRLAAQVVFQNFTSLLLKFEFLNLQKEEHFLKQMTVAVYQIYGKFLSSIVSLKNFAI